MEEHDLRTGDAVAKEGGDYRFDGIVVAIFDKLHGGVRVVVEDERGLLFIFNPKQLRVTKRRAVVWGSKTTV